MADDRNLDTQQAAMAEQATASTDAPPAPESSPDGEKTRRSPIKGTCDHILSAFVETKRQAWEADTTPAKGVSQKQHDACRETALALLAALASDIATYRDEERTYPGSSGKWYGFERADGHRWAEQCSSVPTAASHASAVKCIGPFAGKGPATTYSDARLDKAIAMFAKQGKNFANLPTVFTVAK